MDLISILIFVVVVVVLVVAICMIAERTLPGDIVWIVKVLAGLIGIIAILYKLLPLAGVH